MKITKKEFNEVKEEILNYFNPKKCEIKPHYITKNGYTLNTIYGEYIFRFSDNNTIFGKFQDVKLMNSLLPDRYQTVNNTQFEIKHYPNIFSGKMNFHYIDIYDFIDTLDRLVVIEKIA